MSTSSSTGSLALRVATIVWAALTLIHFTIWMLIAIIGGHLDQPWWIYVGAPPGAVIGALWWASANAPRSD